MLRFSHPIRPFCLCLFNFLSFGMLIVTQMGCDPNRISLTGKHPSSKNTKQEQPHVSSLEKPQAANKQEPTIASYQQLLFSGLNPSATPWQASIIRLDLTSEIPELLIRGESSDPAMFASGDEVLFFNRSFDSQNFRRFIPTIKSGATKLLKTEQTSFPGGEVGDPIDALYLGSDRVLLAQYMQGKLTIMEQSSGKELATIAADWDLPPGVSLRPAALIPIDQDDQRFIYVVHQALSLENGRMLANGSQQVFVLKDTGDDLRPVDIDPITNKVQGIRIQGTYPIPVRYQQREKILLVSLCSRLLQTDNQARSCFSAIEELDPQTHTASLVWNLNQTNLFMNGGVAPGPDTHSFFASIEQKDIKDKDTKDKDTEEGTSTKFSRRVVKIQLQDKTIQPIYDYSPNSLGFWAMFYDEARKTLFIGDQNDSTVGKFVVLPETGASREIFLDVAPYTGTFLSPVAQE